MLGGFRSRRVLLKTAGRSEHDREPTRSAKTRLKLTVPRLDPELCFTDEGYSGGTLVRPALERLRDQAAAGTFDKVYAHSPDRLSRKCPYQVLLVEELQRNGVEIVFLNHDIGRSPEENLLLQVQGMMAEYDARRFWNGADEVNGLERKRGLSTSFASRPYGYRYIGKYEGGGQDETK